MGFKEKFQENWEKRDEECLACGAITKRQKGITKQNVQRLFKMRWDFNEIMFWVFLILVIFLALSYQKETQQCREWLTPMFNSDIDTCRMICNNKCTKAFETQTYDNPFINSSLG